MSKLSVRTYSRYSGEAVRLLGKMIRSGRKERGLTTQDLADRAGVSRSMLQRIERGVPTVGIGSVFEVAAIVGVKLFDADGRGLERLSRQVDDRLALLPKSVRSRDREVIDDF
ncbi:helix-turn-helix transcriptional regulator [Pseudodesulfovibrio portus]|uniref:Transcriptional regulator n=1 Tax=Pseudodesulfovibrio portus TaxID=231439 RepID=A0ABM8AQU2_9BACT|nr:helix-turn-helix domain-containing protein [Pseudodesulfovibrio portus]BDQ33789.1 transcriptional regulator [Pseudodesulfovibrio portus]